MVELLLFAQGGIFERSFARGQRSAVRAVDQAVSVQGFEILTNRNLGGFELLGKFRDEDSSLAIQHIEDGATAFFVKHWIGWLCPR